MIRNLLYSLFLHFVVLIIMFISGLSIITSNLSSKVTKHKPLNIQIIDEKTLLQKYESNNVLSNQNNISLSKEVKQEEKIDKTKIKKTELSKAKNITKQNIKNNKSLLKSNNSINNDLVIKEEKNKEDFKEQKALEKDKEETKTAKKEDIEFVETIFSDDFDNFVLNDFKEALSNNEEEEKIAAGSMIIQIAGKNNEELTIREKINIQRQIKSCYKLAISKSGLDSKSSVALNIEINANGTIDMNKATLNEALGINKINDKEFIIALENAKSSLVFCSPLRNLPVYKYKIWREMTLIFDSNNLN